MQPAAIAQKFSGLNLNHTSVDANEDGVPPLPPLACYGNLRISSVIFEGIEPEVAAAAEAAAGQFGDKPVKIVLPWSPWQDDLAIANGQFLDLTHPVKVPQAAF